MLTMLIELDTTRYAKIRRKDVLAILERADLKPDALVMHRNRLFSARYLRSRNLDFKPGQVEARLEATDHRVAIFKRPSRRDRGRYVTLQFAVADARKLDLTNLQTLRKTEAAKQTAKSIRSSITSELAAIKIGDELPALTGESREALLSMLGGVSRSMRQLAQYAHELAMKNQKRDHLLATLDELQKQVGVMTDGINRLIEAPQDIPPLPAGA